MLKTLFPRNQATIERAGRIALGLLLLALVFVGPKTPFGMLGLVPLLTGLAGSCPIYRILGITTCPIDAGRRNS